MNKMNAIAAGLRGFSTGYEQHWINLIHKEIARRGYVKRHGEPTTEEERRKCVKRILLAESLREGGRLRRDRNELNRLIGVFTRPKYSYQIAVPDENGYGGTHYVSRKGDLSDDLKDHHGHLSDEQLLQRIEKYTAAIEENRRQEREYLDKMGFAFQESTKPSNIHNGRSASVESALAGVPNSYS